jgi:hypothetical protein
MFFMHRPRRQAARDALEKIHGIQEWENLSENSELFRQCAAKIDAEFEAEVLKTDVQNADFEMSGSNEEEIEDEDNDSDDSFVVQDHDSLANYEEDHNFLVSIVGSPDPEKK